jgi:hypothetical protein
MPQLPIRLHLPKLVEARTGELSMMHDGIMMWGMGLGGLLVLVILILVIAALIKYVFFR